MTLLRRLSYLTILLAFAQIVFGAIVRITGSGMGCGDHWPNCNGAWVPQLVQTDHIIEFTHRVIAAGLTVAILALLATAWSKARDVKTAAAAPGSPTHVAGRGGVLRSAMLATGLVIIAAIFGAITVKLSLNPYVIVTHLAIAMTLLAVLAVTAIRAGGFGVLSGSAERASPRSFRAAAAAVVLAFLVLVMGALTANIAGANVSCQGFPGCRVVAVHGAPLVIQVTHRVLAFLLFFHLIGVAMAARKRREPAVIRRAAWVALAAVLAQLLVAAALVEMHLPPVLRSLHQATGTAVWLAVVVLAYLARRLTERSVLATA